VRVCAICEGDIPNLNPTQKTCGHPRCSNTYRRQKPERDRATRRARHKPRVEVLPRKPVTTKSMTSVTARRDIANAVRRALEAGTDMTTAIKHVSSTMGHPPAVVMSVWKSAG